MSLLLIIQIVLLVLFCDGAGAVLFEPNYEGLGFTR
jgi:3-oxoacyl-[acyl-carrier-protein] synthase III